MRSIKIIVFVVIGLFFGIGWFQLDTSGYFERWQKLTEPSTEILNLFSPGIVPDEYGNPQVCDFSLPEFSFLSNHPKEIAECIQQINMEAEANTRTVYVIDSNGEVWRWSYFSYAYDYYAKRIILPAVGMVFGLFIGLLASRQNPRPLQRC